MSAARVVVTVPGLLVARVEIDVEGDDKAGAAERLFRQVGEACVAVADRLGEEREGAAAMAAEARGEARGWPLDEFGLSGSPDGEGRTTNALAGAGRVSPDGETQ